MLVISMSNSRRSLHKHRYRYGCFKKEDFADNRDYYVLMQSPELYKKYNDQRSSLSTQLNKYMPTTKSSGLSPAEIYENQVVQNILRPELGDEVHHKNSLSLIGTMLANSDDAGKEAIFNVLEHNGVSIGDDIYNLLNLDEKSHDALHKFAQEQGLEIQGIGGKGSRGMAKRVNESRDIMTTLNLLQDYIDYGIPLLTEEQDRLLQEADARKAGQMPSRLIQRARETGAKSIDGVNQDDKNVTINAENVYMEKAVNGNGKMVSGCLCEGDNLPINSSYVTSSLLCLFLL